MTTLETIATIGVTAFVVGAGVSIYLMTKRKDSEDKMDFDQFLEKCISKASTYGNENVATAIIVIDKVNDKVYPSLYRKYNDGRVTKIKLSISPFQYNFLPEGIKTSFNNGQAVLKKLNNEL